MINPYYPHFYQSCLRSCLNSCLIYSILSLCYTKAEYYYNFSIVCLNYSNLNRFVFIFEFCYYPTILNIQSMTFDFPNWLSWVYHPNSLQCLVHYISHFSWTSPSTEIDLSCDFAGLAPLTSEPSFAVELSSSSLHPTLYETTETSKLCFTRCCSMSFGCELFRFWVEVRFIAACLARKIDHYWLPAGLRTAGSWFELDYCACSSRGSMLSSCGSLNSV